MDDIIQESEVAVDAEVEVGAEVLNPRVNNRRKSIQLRIIPYKHCLPSNMTCTWCR